MHTLRRLLHTARTEWRVGLALLSVYLIWGSTYFAMAIALETFPPFWLGGIRLGAALLRRHNNIQRFNYLTSFSPSLMGSGLGTILSA